MIEVLLNLQVNNLDGSENLQAFYKTQHGGVDDIIYSWRIDLERYVQLCYITLPDAAATTAP